MKQYFARAAESEHGEGTAYLEVTAGWPTRQVEIYGGIWRWADREHNEWLADQPLEVLELTEADAISAVEFERVWDEAQKRCPPRS
jgi:hypothetical protein